MNEHAGGHFQFMILCIRHRRRELTNLANTEQLLMTAKEAARALAISPRKLWSLTAGGKIRAVRIGRSVRYDPADLSEWIEKQKT